MGSNPTQDSFFFEKRESCPGCISLPLLACHVGLQTKIGLKKNMKSALMAA